MHFMALWKGVRTQQDARVKLSLLSLCPACPVMPVQRRIMCAFSSGGPSLWKKRRCGRGKGVEQEIIITSMRPVKRMGQERTVGNQASYNGDRPKNRGNPEQTHTGVESRQTNLLLARAYMPACIPMYSRPRTCIGPCAWALSLIHI